MELLKKIEWKQVVIALAALGVITTSDPDAAILSILAMVIVLLINLAAKAQGKPVGRGAVSLFVYAVAFVLAIASNPPALGLPVWAGDPASFMSEVAGLIAAFGPYALAMTGSATILYNALSKLVVEKLDNHQPTG